MPDRFLTAFRTQLERFLLVWLTVLCAVAYWWTDWSGRLGQLVVPDPFVGSKPGLNWLIAATMLAIGSLLPRDEIRQVFQRWPTVLGGTAIQYTSMPLLAYGLGRLFGLEGPWMIGIIMVGCVPGAMASNVLTLVARGNVSYSVSLTTSATILSPILVPLGLWLALSGLAEYSMATVFWKVVAASGLLLLMVVLPVLAGYWLSRTFALWERTARRVAAIVANLTILWIIAVVVALNRDNLSQLEARLLLALLTVNVGGYSVGFVGGLLLRLSDPMRRALTLEIGMQNAGLGTALALSLFKEEPATAIPAALYTFGCMFTGIVLARLWAELGGREEAGSSP